MVGRRHVYSYGALLEFLQGMRNLYRDKALKVPNDKARVRKKFSYYTILYIILVNGLTAKEAIECVKKALEQKERKVYVMQSYKKGVTKYRQCEIPKDISYEELAMVPKAIDIEKYNKAVITKIYLTARKHGFTVQDLRRAFMIKVLEESGWDIKKLAEVMNWSRKTATDRTHYIRYLIDPRLLKRSDYYYKFQLRNKPDYVPRPSNFRWRSREEQLREVGEEDEE